MPEIEGIDKLFCVFPQKRFSKFRLLGTSQMGLSNYGSEDLYFNRTGYGKASFGSDFFANIIELSGIYKTSNSTGKRKFFRFRFYITKNPRTIPQQSNRSKMTSAVLAYQALTASEKMLYHKRAVGKRMSGYNLFLKEHLLSH